jgi:eukaryotic-like serine/threonine-protein kinase
MTSSPSIEHHAAEEFGEYLVYERLGMGGMATVHRAKKRGIAGFERGVALKRLLPHLAQDKEFIQSFVREAKLASLLVHPNIAQIYELGRVGAAYYIAMEHVEGIDVRKILRYARRSGEVVPLPVALSIIAELCDALEYAHTYVNELGEHIGIVHRDVSPSNLIISNSGHLKVIDFGIAKASPKQHNTESGRVKGKLGYLSPEAAMGKSYGPPSDVFSAGVVAFELLTTHPLFWAKNDYDTLQKIHQGEVPPPSRINPAVPPDLDKVILQALCRSAADRTQSAGDLRIGIDRIATRFGYRLSSREVFDWLSGVSSESWATLRPAPRSLSQQQAAASASQLRPLPLPPPPEPSQSSRAINNAGRSTSILQAAALAEAGHVVGPGSGVIALPGAAEVDVIAELAWGSDGQSYPLIELPGKPASTSAMTSTSVIRVPDLSPRRWALPLGVAAALTAAAGAVMALRAPSRAEVPASSHAILNFAVQPPDASIAIGGVEVGRAAPRRAEVDPGVYSISIKRAGYQPWIKDVTVRAGEVQAIHVALEPAPTSATAPSAGAPADVAGVAAAEAGDAEATGTRAPRERALARPAPRRSSDELADPAAPSLTPPSPSAAGVEASPASPAPAASPLPAAELPPAAPSTPVAGEVRAPSVTATTSPSSSPSSSPPSSPPAMPLISASAVTKLSGEMAPLHMRNARDDLSDVVAKLCIDEQGRVTSAETVRAAPEISADVQRSLRAWRYKPYLAQGKPTSACFPLSMRVVVVSSN